MDMKKLFKHLTFLAAGMLTLCSTSSLTLLDSINTGVRKQNEDTKDSQEVLFKLYYYRSDNDSSFNNIWFWSEDESNPGAGYTYFTGETKTFPQTSDMVWYEAVIYNNETISVTSQWSVFNDGYRDLTVTQNSFSGGLIIRNGDGSRQTGELKVDFDQLSKTESKEIFYIDKGDKVGGDFFYDVNAIPSYSVTNVRFDQNGFDLPVLDFTTKSTIDFNISDMKVRKYRYVSGSKSYSSSDVNLSGNLRKVATNHYRVDLTNITVIDPTWKYDLTVVDSKGSSTYDIDMQTYYSTPLFEDNYTPDENLQLGSFIRYNTETNSEETVFRVWTPFSNETRLLVYEGPDTITPKISKLMKNIGKGVYELVIDENLGGNYYNFSVLNFGKQTVRIPDPYQESRNANSTRSMIVDWNSPEVLPTYQNDEFQAEFGTWDEVKPSDVQAYNASVSELHIRDFSSDTSWTGSQENVGKYMALTESGLTLKDSSTKIGYDYLKQLSNSGLTHIQLLPIYDFASVDETKLDDEDYINKTSTGIFNWGYDPQSYNSPEGSYSSNPNDGYVRIRELRSVIQAMYKADLGVVMDVVYNHMPSISGTMFNKVAPGYYFRTQDVTGAGATMITTRKMYSKFMEDSMKMWAERYQLSGFRFDLMGVMDARTIMDCADAVRDIKPNALVYGEGWQMYSSTGDQGPDEMMASQKNLIYFGTEKYSTTGQIEEGQFVGAFNDNYRDSLNGGTGNIDRKGFMQNAYDEVYTTNSTERKKAYYGIYGTHPWNYGNFTEGGNAGFDAYSYSNLYTGASVNYTECHDNLTAYDKLYATMKDENIAKSLSALGNVVTATSLGVAFYQFGQEFGRSKQITDPLYLEDQVVLKSAYSTKINGETIYFSHNSYNTGDKVNSIKWNLVEENSWMIDVFMGALTGRKYINSVASMSDLENVYYTGNDYFGITDATTRYNTISVMASSTHPTSGNNGIFFFVNPTKHSKTIKIPYASGVSAYVLAGDHYGEYVTNEVTINPTSFIIMTA